LRSLTVCLCANYLYNIGYRITNSTNAPVTYSLSDFTVFGPAGETMAGYSSFDRGRPITVPANASSNGSTLLNGTSAGHPYADACASYQLQRRRQEWCVIGRSHRGP
jgi:hypothetical protein